jgi:hypothetical protein
LWDLHLPRWNFSEGYRRETFVSARFIEYTHHPPPPKSRHNFSLCVTDITGTAKCHFSSLNVEEQLYKIGSTNAQLRQFQFAKKNNFHSIDRAIACSCYYLKKLCLRLKLLFLYRKTGQTLAMCLQNAPVCTFDIPLLLFVHEVTT